MLATADSLAIRQDLSAHELNTTEGRFIVVRDIASGRSYRFQDAEFFIAQQFDGATSLDIIRQRVELRYRSPVSPSALDQFVATLYKRGLLTTDGDQGHLGAGRGRAPSGKFNIPLKTLNPDTLLGRLTRIAPFLFNPMLLAIFSALVLVAVEIVFASWKDVGRDIARLNPISLIVGGWLTITILGLIHEISHALACKKYGGAVTEIGLRLRFFQPVLYANVSDAWLFPDRRKRLAVVFLGIYPQLIVWALAATLWLMLPATNALGAQALVIMLAAGFKLLIDLNPIFRLDGYYLLSGAFGIPDLANRSFSFTRRSRGKTAGGAAAVKGKFISRQKMLVGLTSLIALGMTFFTIGIFALVLTRLPNGAIIAAAISAASLFAAVAMLVLQKRQAATTADADGEAAVADSGQPEAAAGAQDNPEGEIDAPAKRRLPKLSFPTLKLGGFRRRSAKSEDDQEAETLEEAS